MGRAASPPSRERKDLLASDGETIAARYLFIGAGRRVAFVDRSIELLWGVTSHTLRSEPKLWLERIHPDDRPQVVAAFEGPSGSTWSLDYRVRRRDGTVVWVNDQGRALKVGRSRQVSGRVVDVTRQRRLEERLRVQVQLIDAVGESVMAADRAGLVSSWNRAAARLFGVKAGEAVGRPLVELVFAPAQRDVVVDAMRGVLELGASWSGELRLLRRDGREVPGHVTLAPLVGADDAVTGVVVMALDINDLRTAQARAEKSEHDHRGLVEQLRRLTAHLHVVREQEQRRIARDVHDELGQMLTGLKLDVGWLRRRVESGVDIRNGNPSANGDASGSGDLTGAQLRERLAGIAQLVDQTLDAVRHIARQLRPPALDDLGLETAVEWLVEDFRSRTGLACELRCDLDGLPAPGPHDTAAFRIVQEALTNVTRHAEAAHVLVDLRQVRGRLVIDVVDDGRGVPRAALRAPFSLGIIGMRERARACGGELTLRRVAGGGTRVRARLPLTGADAPAPATAADAAPVAEGAAAETSR